MKDILKQLNAEWKKITLLSEGDPVEAQVLVECKSQHAYQPNQEVHPLDQD